VKIVLAALILLSSLTVSAQSRLVSVDAFDLAYTGGLLFKSDDAKSGKDRNESKFRLNLNYAQNLPEYVGLMWKARIKFDRSDVDWGSYDEFASTYGVAGGVLYNFTANDVKNSFYTGALVGIERQTIDTSAQSQETGYNFALDLEAGKRWDLGSYSVANIAYAPSVSFTVKRYGGDIRDEYFKSGTELKLNFLKFDVLF